jgi:hypothetical protein
MLSRQWGEPAVADAAPGIVLGGDELAHRREDARPGVGVAPAPRCGGVVLQLGEPPIVSGRRAAQEVTDVGGFGEPFTGGHRLRRVRARDDAVDMDELERQHGSPGPRPHDRAVAAHTLHDGSHALFVADRNTGRDVPEAAAPSGRRPRLVGPASLGDLVSVLTWRQLEASSPPPVATGRQ